MQTRVILHLAANVWEVKRLYIGELISQRINQIDLHLKNDSHGIDK